MKRSIGIAAALVAIGGAALPALAATRYGSFTLRPGETQQISIGAAAQELRVCNDATSAGRISVTVGTNEPRLLRPGLCYDYDIGDRIVATNQGDGPAFGTYGLSYGAIHDHPMHFRFHH
jgi:hypothetical protein